MAPPGADVARPLRVCMLSVHTCPLAAPGGKETGGRNVYVRELMRQLSRRGVLVDAFTRSQSSLEPHIADTDLSTRVTISRPSGIRATRRGELVDQDFYYDGRTLTLYNPIDRVYATVDAPPTIEGVLHFAHDRLGLAVPAGDLVYPNPYPHLIAGVTHAAVLGRPSSAGSSATTCCSSSRGSTSRCGWPRRAPRSR